MESIQGIMSQANSERENHVPALHDLVWWLRAPVSFLNLFPWRQQQGRGLHAPWALSQ